MKVLAVDDERVALASIRRLLRRRGMNEVDICESGEEAIGLIRRQDYDIVLLDLLMPAVDGMQVLEAAKPFSPSTEFIVVTAVDDVSAAVKAVRLGAYDYLVKPVDNERLCLSIERAYERKALIAGLAGSGEGSAQVPKAFSEIVTQNPRMKEVLRYSEIIARSGNPVLITGETGTGKELVARGIHRAGPTPDGPFLAVNVASIPESLFESQLFGHVKGAFTGAERAYAGYFEQASAGTLFLDEIGELPLNLQVKMLRVLEEKYVVPLGDTKPINVNARIVSATNKDLDQSCREGRFRLDLMYRLKSAHIHMPPLREREGDIPLIASHFLCEACKRYGKKAKTFSPEAMQVLTARALPGNVRELAQLVDNAVLFSDSPVITPRHLGENCPAAPPSARSLCTLKKNDEMHVLFVLEHTGGDRKQAAKILGITLRQLQRKLALISLRSGGHGRQARQGP